MDREAWGGSAVRDPALQQCDPARHSGTSQMKMKRTPVAALAWRGAEDSGSSSRGFQTEDYGLAVLYYFCKRLKEALGASCRHPAIIIINSFIICLAINNVAYAALVSQWY